jgi:signal recognition particle subunit SRP19
MATAVQLASISRRERNINTPIGSFNPQRKHSEQSRWICIYPAYLNNKKTVAEGRRIPLDKACENPTCNEIRDVLLNAGFKVELEAHKVHPRELQKYELLYKGRVRVQLKTDDDKPVKENLDNSKFFFFLLYIVGLFLRF